MGKQRKLILISLNAGAKGRPQSSLGLGEMSAKMYRNGRPQLLKGAPFLSQGLRELLNLATAPSPVSSRWKGGCPIPSDSCPHSHWSSAGGKKLQKHIKLCWEAADLVKLKYFKITHLWGSLHSLAGSELSVMHLLHWSAGRDGRTPQGVRVSLAWQGRPGWPVLGWLSGYRTRRLLSPMRPLIRYLCSNMTKIREFGENKGNLLYRELRLC